MLADFFIDLGEVPDVRKPLAVQIKVYNKPADLRRAATIYTNNSNKRGGGKKNDTNFSDTLGVCHRFHLRDNPVCAIVRLASPNLGAGLVAHELAHAAVWIWEIQHKFKHEPIRCDNDEWFCWVLGELVRQTTDQLYERGVYK